MIGLHIGSFHPTWCHMAHWWEHLPSRGHCANQGIVLSVDVYDFVQTDMWVADMFLQYADENNIKFNDSKSCMLLFKGIQFKDSQRPLIIDGVTIHCSKSVCDLGHNVSTNDKDSIAKSDKASFWRSFNLFRSDLRHIYSFTKRKLYQQ